MINTGIKIWLTEAKMFQSYFNCGLFKKVADLIVIVDELVYGRVQDCPEHDLYSVLCRTFIIHSTP